MQVLRLYDPARRPPNGIDLIQSHQFVAFASHADTGAPVDPEGQPFHSPDETSCLVFETLAEARAFGEALIARHESLRLEVFDARGRVDEPLLLVVSPARANRLDGSARMTRVRTWSAIALIVAGPPLIYYDYHVSGGSMVLPTFLGVSMLLSAIRLLFMNMVVREATKKRQERLRQYE